MGACKFYRISICMKALEMSSRGLLERVLLHRFLSKYFAICIVGKWIASCELSRNKWNNNKKNTLNGDSEYDSRSPYLLTVWCANKNPDSPSQVVCIEMLMHTKYDSFYDNSLFTSNLKTYSLKTVTINSASETMRIYHYAGEANTHNVVYGKLP